MRYYVSAAAAMAALLSFMPAISPAHAEIENCTEITALPFTISVQGIYCLKQNLNVNLATGNAITVNAGNVIIDFNGWRVNNQASLLTNQANGVFASDRKNITLKNGFIRGFFVGINLLETVTDASASHLVEDMKVADFGNIGIQINGNQSVVRDNRVLATGGSDAASAFGILLSLADDGVVSGNVVSGVSETSNNYGVYVAFSNRVRVGDNVLSGINGGNMNDRAIGLNGVAQAIISSNRLLNDPGTGTGGIVDSGASADIACVDNEIGGFTAAPLTGCDFSDGNRILFN